MIESKITYYVETSDNKPQHMIMVKKTPDGLEHSIGTCGSLRRGEKVAFVSSLNEEETRFTELGAETIVAVGGLDTPIVVSAEKNAIHLDKVGAGPVTIEGSTAVRLNRSDKTHSWLVIGPNKLSIA